MKNILKKAVFILVFVTVLILPVFAGGGQSSSVSNSAAEQGYPAYLNTGNTYPVVKQGNNITISILSRRQTQYGGEANDIWFWKWVEHKMNIKTTIEQVLDAARNERKALLFASGDLPDLMMELSLSTSEIIRYGTTDKQLYDVSKLLNPALSPNLLKAMEEVPDARTLLTSPDGGIYSFPLISSLINVQGGGYQRLYMNTKWLAQVGLGRPETLEDFYTILKAFKEKDPSGTGRIIPLGGGNNASNPQHFVLSALGFVNKSSSLTGPALRSGKVEIPAGSPVFRDFLVYMNRLYAEGLIDPDYYTINDAQINARLAEKRVGVWPGSAVYTQQPQYEDFSQFEALSPVTSPQNSVKLTNNGDVIAISGDVISAKTRYPEVCMRLMDYFYTVEGVIYHLEGPPVNKNEPTFGMFNPWFWDAERSSAIFPDVESGKYVSNYENRLREISPIVNRRGYVAIATDAIRELAGQPREENLQFDTLSGDGNMRASVYELAVPYGIDAYPNIVYFTPQESTRISDLQTVINNFVSQEAARFITGANSINNFDRYLNELNALGYKEYQDFYIKAYENYLAAKR